MERCGNCKRDLADVRVGSPCPDCGSRVRDAVVSVGTVGAIAYVGQTVELDIASAVHAVKSDTVTLKPVLIPATFETEVYGPTPDAPGNVTLAWDGDDLRAVVVNLPDADDD